MASVAAAPLVPHGETLTVRRCSCSAPCLGLSQNRGVDVPVGRLIGKLLGSSKLRIPEYGLGDTGAKAGDLHYRVASVGRNGMQRRDNSCHDIVGIGDPGP